MAGDDRPQYQHGLGTIGGQTFHWGSGSPGQYWSIPYGDYPVTPDAPTGAWAHRVGAIPIANNVIPDPQLGRNRIGIMIHSGSAPDLDTLYTEGCFKVAPSEWPAVRQEILSEAKSGPLYLHVAPGGVAAFTNTPTYSQAGSSTPAANANAAANTSASPAPSGTTVNASNTPIAGALAHPGTPTPGTPVNDYYHTVMMHESGGQNIPNSVGGWGAAGGYYQFTPATYAGVRSAHPDLNLPANIQDANLDQQTAAMKALTQGNVDALTKAGVPINDKNVALAHFLGPGGASNFYAQMTKNPGASAADLFPKEAAANPTVFNSKDGPRTLQQVYDLQTANHGAGNTTGFGPDAAPATAVASTTPAAAPADQSWWSKLTGSPVDAQGNPTGKNSPLQDLTQAAVTKLGNEGQTPREEAPQDSSAAAAQYSQARFSPGARNVSPGLQNIQQTYGTTLNAAMQPLTWTDAPPGAPKQPAAGQRGPLMAQTPGVSINSVQPLPQGLGYGVDPNIGYGYG